MFILYVEYTVEIITRVDVVYNSVILATERRNQEDCEFMEVADYMTRIFSKIIRKQKKEGDRMDKGSWKQKIRVLI